MALVAKKKGAVAKKMTDGQPSNHALVFVNTDNVVISKPKEIAETYVERFMSATNTELDLEQVKIYDTVAQVMGDESNAATREAVIADRIKALQTQADRENDPNTFTAPSAIDAPILVTANKYGDLVGHDATCNAILNRVADAGETLTGAPLEMAYALATTRKWNIKVSNDGYIDGVFVPDRDGNDVGIHIAWPVPGSSNKGKPAGYLADKGKIGDRKFHFVGELLSCFDVAHQLKSDMNDLANLGIQGFDHTKIKRQEYVDMYAENSEARKGELDRLSARWGKMIRCANTAIAFLQVSTWLKVDFPGAVWGFPTAETFNGHSAQHVAKVAALRKPIQWNPKNDGRAAKTVPAWTLSQFNSLQLPSKKHNGHIKLNVAKANGGTLGAVLKTVERADKTDAQNKQGGDKDKTGKSFPIPTVQQIEGFMNGLNSGLDEKYDADTALAYRNKIIGWLGQGTTPSSKELILSFDRMVDELNMVRAPLRDTVERIRAEIRQAAIDKEKLDKAAAAAAKAAA